MPSKPSASANKAPPSVARPQPVFDCRKTYFVSPQLEQMVQVQKFSSDQANQLCEVQKKAMDNYSVYLTPREASFAKGLTPHHTLHGYHVGTRMAGARLGAAMGSGFGEEGANLKRIIEGAKKSQAVIGELKKSAEKIDLSLIKSLGQKMEAIQAKNPDSFTTDEFLEIANVMQLAGNIKRIDTTGGPSGTQFEEAEGSVSRVWATMKHLEKMGNRDVPILCSPVELLAFHGSCATVEAVKGRDQLMDAYAKVGILEPAVLEILGLTNLPGKKAAAVEASGGSATKRVKRSEVDASAGGSKPADKSAAPAASSAEANNDTLMAQLQELVGDVPAGDGGYGL